MSVDQIVQLIQSAIQFGTVILFGAMGEILTEKSGNLNLGVPGIMYLGGIADWPPPSSMSSTIPIPPVSCVW